MITSLRIQSLAIIESLEIDLREGLNVLTGETGAGKSIIVGAVDLILGGRAQADSIRSGADEAVVEAMFLLRDEAPREALREQGLADDEPSVMLVRRVIARSGRNRTYINGNLATAGMLRSVTRSLVDVSSQHAQYALLDPATHLDILDRYGSSVERRREYEAGYAAMRKLQGERDELMRADRERAEREDFLSFQLRELSDAALEPGEDDALEADLRRLQNAEKLRSGASGAESTLDGGRSSVVSGLVAAEEMLAGLADIDPELSQLRQRVETSRIEVADVAFELRRYASSVESDPARLNQIHERWEVIRRLKRKLGATIEEILARKAEMEDELDRLASAETRITELETELSAARDRLLALGHRLSQARKEAGRRLSRAVEQELADLAMGACRVHVRVDPATEASGAPALMSTGIDVVELRVATNPGEPEKPLARCASGGELSRILLALKSVLLASDPVATSIYDEVDAGVGGAVAEILGRKLKRASEGRQVLCITHLPQVAAYAAHHLLVSKEEQDGRTVTRVEALPDGERPAEIARMLGGVTITDRTMAHAQEMLRNARALPQ